MGRTKQTPEQKKEQEQKQKDLLTILFKPEYNNNDIQKTFLNPNWLTELEKFYSGKKEPVQPIVDYKSKFEKLLKQIQKINQIIKE